MGDRTAIRRTREPELPRDARAEEILEFVHNGEDEALCDEQVALSHRRDVPALKEHLRDMHELDFQPGVARWH